MSVDGFIIRLVGGEHDVYVGKDGGPTLNRDDAHDFSRAGAELWVSENKHHFDGLILEIVSTNPYPEHAKLRQIAPQSQACGEFIDWLRGEKQIHLCSAHYHSDECYAPETDGSKSSPSPLGARGPICGMLNGQQIVAAINIIDLLAEHFGIDQRKLDDEKRAMLEECRAKT